MPRPLCCRRVSGEPPSNFFKPLGIPLVALEPVTMTVDEFEAVRLADLEGLYQEAAAERMGISRATFGRIIESAHKKVADALVSGKALEIKGGEVEMAEQRQFLCVDCQHKWMVPFGTGRPAGCPKCRSRNIHRSSEGRGWARPSAGSEGGMHRGRCRRERGPESNRQGGSK
jgi:predicted DNA-binding protein (UPF0251 family)